MTRIVQWPLLALLAGCNVSATEFSKGQFTFAPPAGFEEPYWHPGKTPNAKEYFRGEIGAGTMLSVTWRTFSIDSPLTAAEQPAANDTCAQAGLEGLFRGKNAFAERHALQSHGEIQRIDVSGVPAALIEYKALRGKDMQRGFVACIAKGKEALLVIFEEPVTRDAFALAIGALKNTVVR